eukprot:m.216519 g.216519  ORF g.216519 m.216519 type:complete len:510 (-) comp17202_c0_seq1:3497-5026(-)
MGADAFESQQAALFVRLGITLKQRDKSVLCLSVLWFFAGVEYAVILPTLWLYLQSLDFGERWYFGLVLSSFSAAGMISAPIFGLFADRGGVKGLLMLSSVLMVVGNFLYFVANDGYVVLEGRVIAGLGAGVASASFAYLARVTLREERTRVIGTVMAARQLGLLFGPALNFGTEHLHFPIGPFEVTSLTVPGLVMVLCWTITGLTVYVMFTDIDAPLSSAPGTRRVSRQPSRQPSYNNLSARRGEKAPLLSDIHPRLPDMSARYHEAINEYGDETKVPDQGSPNGELVYTVIPTRWQEYTQMPVLALFGVSFLCIFNQLALETWVTPFTQQYFDWQETANSVMYMLVGLVAVSMFLCVRALANRGVADRYLMLIGLVAECVGLVTALVLIPLVHPHTTTALIVFVVVVFLIVSGLPFLFIPVPALQSKLTSEATQGFGQGLRRTVISVGTIIGPLWAGLMSREPYPFLGLMIGLLAVASLAFFWVFGRLVPAEETDISLVDEVADDDKT